ncbi:hypothetical protein FF38_08765 [Lucilia cuprina]|uniref:Uncharacterized protein n=1 Tax=Lucilia cuprina TaxID=7375 RepID=A0A0L0CN00_LUCCU|nr:hypothetical protein FF38_08765 [Lucilia cuprina]
MMLCVMFILWRIKGDKALKEWLQLLMSLETNYFDKWNTKYCISFFINSYLYVLICDRVSQTTKETTNILMEDCTTQQNREQIEYLCLVRSVLPLNIEICGIIDIDFKYFFGIIKIAK